VVSSGRLAGHPPTFSWRRRLARLALVALVAVVAVGLTPAIPGAQVVRAWDAGTFSSADENLLFTLTNQARASAGLAPLRNDGQLHSLAEWRAQDMSVRGYFSHEIPPQGYMVFHYMDQRGIQYVLAGENIGWDNASDDEATPMIQQMFMNSPEHRSNILGALWDSMGVGAYKGTDGKLMYCVLFMESKPAATPTPEPTATPSVTATAAPRRTEAPTPRPTPAPAATPRPAAAAPPATPTPTPIPAPTVSAQPANVAPARTVGPSIASTEAPATPTAPQSMAAPSQRILDDAPAPGLLQSLIGGLFGFISTP